MQEAGPLVQGHPPAGTSAAVSLQRHWTSLLLSVNTRGEATSGFYNKKVDTKTCHTRKDCEKEFCEDGIPSPGLAQPVLAAIINNMSTVTCEERASFHSLTAAAAHCH